MYTAAFLYTIATVVFTLAAVASVNTPTAICYGVASIVTALSAVGLLIMDE